MRCRPVGLLGVALLLSACGSDPFQVTGTLQVMGKVASKLDCDGLAEGDKVRVTSGSGELIGVGLLEEPDYEYRSGARTGEPVLCTFAFAVPDVSPGEKFYELEINGKDAGTYSEDEIREPLTVG